MSESCSTLTVYFEDPFWVGIYERQNAGKLEVCKIVYGPEPKIYEVYEHLLTNWYRFSFSPPVDAESSTARTLNPKRLQRQVKRQLASEGVSTKAQQALKLQREEGKLQHKVISRKLKRQSRSDALLCIGKSKKQGTEVIDLCALLLVTMI